MKTKHNYYNKSNKGIKEPIDSLEEYEKSQYDMHDIKYEDQKEMDDFFKSLIKAK